ncbi:MAG: hypothetical protein E7E54_09470, partial [Varibaculum cambriense]
RRLKVGSFSVSGAARSDAPFNAYSLAELSGLVTAGGELPVVSLDQICQHLFPCCQVTPEVITALGYGQRPQISTEVSRELEKEDSNAAEKIYGLYLPGQKISLLASPVEGKWRSVLSLQSN